MTTQSFNLLDYVKELENVGVSREQAEVQAKTLNNAINSIIQEYDEKTRKDLATKGDIRELETKLENKIVVFEKNMTIKLGTITAVVGALIVVLLNIL